jgi:hypothetical protein
MKKTMITVATLALLAGCAATTARQPQPHCIFEVARTVEHAGGSFTKIECAVWSFGPTPAQAAEWERRHPTKLAPAQ